MNYTFKKNYIKFLSDTTTPVNIYLKLRDQYQGTFLLESSDYHGNENSFSYICAKPLAGFSYEHGKIREFFPPGEERSETIVNKTDVVKRLRSFASAFVVEKDGNTDFIPAGVFGYITFDSVSCFEEIEFKKQQSEIPDVSYYFFQFIIAINHFKNEMHVLELLQDGQRSDMDPLLSLLHQQAIATYPFKTTAEERSNYSDAEFIAILEKSKQHIFRGDVFQLVLSRRFYTGFRGDDFNVYRSLRSVNPSPYLFYFDFGSFRIFGSSPEAQLQVKNNTAKMFPIAGTFKRTGNDEADNLLAENLKQDPKENAEHVMLVDLARNDLSKCGKQVSVSTFKEIQYYSHVIHLVSEVRAELEPGVAGLDILADTFPAGTLSGAPKYKAMQLIDEHENTPRSFYGGCIGFMNSEGEFNHAITIRSFLSKDNVLHYQAGAGLVESSITENELEEVNNKISALRKAIALANEL
ncbi:MAG TPA: anthranilate synthase component I family protein [Bacteroidia bacterium]